jgi:hypothetical protein
MSDLEVLNRPVIGALIHDLSFALDDSQQTNLAVWTMKTAMLLDAINRERPPFYDATERIQLRTQSAMPPGTVVWIARFSGSGFHVGGTDVWLDQGEVKKAAQGCVTTIIIGHLAIQSVTIHRLQAEHLGQPIESINIKQGEWNRSTTQIWPVSGPVTWPPTLSFTRRGPRSIGALIDRWKTGTNAMLSSPKQPSL